MILIPIFCHSQNGIIINKQNDTLSKEKIYDLEEIYVKANYIKRHGAGYVATIKGNPNALNNNVLAFMNTLPGVSGLNVYNRASKVYIDGRELKMPSNEIVNYLSGIPTESIDNIKVKHQQGMENKSAGIYAALYITTRRAIVEQHSGQVSLNPQYRYKNKSVQADGNASYGFFDKQLSLLTYISANMMDGIKEDMENIIGGANTKEQISRSKSQSSFVLDQNCVYKINSQHELGAGLNIFFKPSEINEYEYYVNDMYLFDKKTDWSKHQEDIFLNYRFIFGENKSSLKVTADLMNSGKSLDENFFYSGYDTLTKYSDNALNFGVKAHMDLFTSSDMGLSFGCSYLSMDSYRKYLPPLYEGTFSKFNYAEKILSIYSELYAPLFDEAFDLTLGIRYELARIHHNNVNFRNSQKFSNLIPALDLTYNYDKDGYYLSIIYDEGVYRPFMSDYAPYMSSNGETISSVIGLYEPLPEYERQIALTQTIEDNTIVGFSYTKRKNELDLAYITDGNSIIETNTSDNCLKEASVYIMSKFDILKGKLKCDFNVSASIANVFNLDKSTSFSYKHMGVALGFKYIFSKRTYVKISGRYSTPTQTLSYKMLNFWGLNANFKHNLNPNWSFEIILNNVLCNDKLIYESLVPGVNLKQTKLMTPSALGVSIIYKLGKYKGRKVSNINDVRNRGVK